MLNLNGFFTVMNANGRVVPVAESSFDVDSSTAGPPRTAALFIEAYLAVRKGVLTWLHVSTKHFLLPCPIFPVA